MEKNCTEENHNETTENAEVVTTETEVPSDETNKEETISIEKVEINGSHDESDEQNISESKR